MEEIVTTVVVPAATVVLSAVLALLTARLESRSQLRREHGLSYLLDAYRGLTDCAGREGWTAERAASFEQALSDIFLLGTAEHISLAQEVRQGMAVRGEAVLDPLIIALRRDLRAQLGLAAVESQGVPILRLSAGEAPAPADALASSPSGTPRAGRGGRGRPGQDSF